MMYGSVLQSESIGDCFAMPLELTTGNSRQLTTANPRISNNMEITKKYIVFKREDTVFYS